MQRKNNNDQIVLPIFYKVKPSDVGYQAGSFGKLFHEREGRLRERSSQDLANLEKWKQALLEVSNVKGYEVHGSEVELVKLVVQRVLRELKKNFELVISENLVGIEIHVKKVTEFLDNTSQATLFVGINGMGGIGKTTLAKAIYNKLSNQFEYRSFIADIRESWKKGVHRFWKQLIGDILQQDIEICDENEGTNIISSRLKDKKVLVVLDDVDNVNRVKRLTGNHDWFSSRSRIIITTRDERIFKGARVDYKYDLKEMDSAQSLILFSKHAFLMDSPPKEFGDLTREVVSITGGLPLCLEVFGSLFYGKESTEWRDMIKKLEKIPRKEVQERLRISYEALDDGQKQIFLDIACFFIDNDKRIASYMWEACKFFPKVNIEELRFMSLIKIEDDRWLGMHDHLRDLGRTIVRENYERQPWKHSRLWDSDEALKVLKANKGTEEIEAIDMSKGSSDGDIYTGEQFKKLTSLRFLHMMKGAHLIGDFKDSVEELKWLRWENCPMNFEVNNLHAAELVVLELSGSKINKRWRGWSSFMMAEKLKFLDLSFCESLETTEFLSAFKNLEVLILNYCSGLRQIDFSIGGMKALLHLELCSCESLTELPESMGSLENLEILDISAIGIEELPNGIGRPRKLRDLNASYCKYLKGERTESMCNLSSPQRLNFLGCMELQSLPDLPSSLTYLGVTCQSRKLPSLSHLTRLKELEVIDCQFLECIPGLPSTLLKNSECSQPTGIEESELPQSLNTPFKLETLMVNACESIETLDVSQFIHLRTLSFYNCHNLLEVRGLDKMKYLESLTVESRHSVERLDLPKFGDPKIVKVEFCKNLVEIQGLKNLESLETPSISRCASMGRLLVPQSRSLRVLDAEYCTKLAEIQGLDGLELLGELNISGCTSNKKLHLPISGGLYKLNVEGSETLAKIQGLNRLEFLEVLNISRCTSIERLDLPKSGSMKELYARGCVNLAEIRGLEGLEFLQKLDISACATIERLDLPKTNKFLRELHAGGCVNLAEIRGLEGLKFLEELDIHGCTTIERLDLPKSHRLKKLHAEYCESLVEIQGLDRLEFLKELHARGCVNLAEIRGLEGLEFLGELDIHGCATIERLDLPKSHDLKKLHVEYCESLVEIQGLDRLEFLEELNISGCVSIERLDLQKSKMLERLDTNNCANIVEIQGLDNLAMSNVSGCTSFERLPNLHCFRYLKSLTINGCDKLQEILSPEIFPSRTSLWIGSCKSLAKLPNLSSFHGLQELFLSTCHELREIPGLEESISLESITISGCSSIELLPDLSSCTRLISPIVQDCEKRTEIRGLKKLEQQVELKISGCKSLKTIPKLSVTRRYRIYKGFAPSISDD
ncbi:disease resistance protein L6-like [Rhodamnia argentea]|uniref:Disease resistance protein L6-like n=1 Tax=Rhodamnia argentea TaxID=178133 RepID=A0ABM3H4A3_9MYRT|nr:disease resistance protein L6-like [Rhodamnia argentea]